MNLQMSFLLALVLLVLASDTLLNHHHVAAASALHSWETKFSYSVPSSAEGYNSSFLHHFQPRVQLSTFWGAVDVRLSWQTKCPSSSSRKTAFFTPQNHTQTSRVILILSRGSSSLADNTTKAKLQDLLRFEVPAGLDVLRVFSVWFSGWDCSTGNVAWSEASAFSQQFHPSQGMKWVDLEQTHDVIPCSDPSRQVNSPCATNSTSAAEMWLRFPATSWQAAGTTESLARASEAKNGQSNSSSGLLLTVFGWNAHAQAHAGQHANASSTAVVVEESCIAAAQNESACAAGNVSSIKVSPALLDHMTGRGYTSRVLQLAGAGGAMCAVREDQTATCWGKNDVAQLGLGDTRNRGHTPSTITLYSGETIDIGAVTAVASGRLNACAIKASGDIVCWGLCGYVVQSSPPCLLMGDEPEELTPTTSVPIKGPFTSVAVGQQHALAVRSDGAVVAWGDNQFGQAAGGEVDVVDPWQNTGLNSTANIGEAAVGVAAGYDHSCVLRASGSVVCFGLNGVAQLGMGNTIDFGNKWSDVQLLPNISVGIGTVADISAAEYMSCAVRVDSSIICWGVNAGDGRLGLDYGSLTSDPYFGGRSGELDESVSVLLSHSFVRVFVSPTHVCALRSDGAIRCWGNNAHGALGFNTGGNVYDLADATDPEERRRGFWWGGRAVDVAVTHHATCVLRADASVWCMGRGSQGAMSRGSLNDNTVSTGVHQGEQRRELLLARSQVVVQSRHASLLVDLECGLRQSCCGISRIGHLICFGAGIDIGLETAETVQLSPGETHFGMRHPIGRAKSVSIGTSQGCAILMTSRDDWVGGGPLACWALAAPQGAAGLPRDEYQPVGMSRGSIRHEHRIANIGSNIVSVASGNQFTCAVRGDEVGSTVCFGIGLFGQLGDLPQFGDVVFGGFGFSSDITTTSAISGLGPMQMVRAGGGTVCGVRRDSTAVCWGRGSDGRAGSNDDLDIGPGWNPIQPFMQVNIGLVTTLDVDEFHACAVRVNGTVVCWGTEQQEPLQGYLGCKGCINQGGLANPFVKPNDGTAPVGLAVSVSISETTSCILRVNGDVFCWGMNDKGQLGLPNHILSIGASDEDLSGLRAAGFGSVRKLAATVGATCALRLDGSTVCVGESVAGIGHGHSLPYNFESSRHVSNGTDLGHLFAPHDWTRSFLRVQTSRFIHPSMKSLPADLLASGSPFLRAVPRLVQTSAHWLQSISETSSAPVFIPAECPGKRFVTWGSSVLCSYDPAEPMWWQQHPTASIEQLAVSANVIPMLASNESRWHRKAIIPSSGAILHISGQLNWVVMWGTPAVYVVSNTSAAACTGVETHDWNYMTCHVPAGVGTDLDLVVHSGADAWVPNTTALRSLSYEPPHLDFAVPIEVWAPSAANTAQSLPYLPPVGGGILRVIGRNFGEESNSAAVVLGSSRCKIRVSQRFSFSDSEFFCEFGNRSTMINTSVFDEFRGQRASVGVQVAVAGQLSNTVSMPVGTPLVQRTYPNAIQQANGESKIPAWATIELFGLFLSGVVSISVSDTPCFLVATNDSKLSCRIDTRNIRTPTDSAIAASIALCSVGECFRVISDLHFLPSPPQTTLRVIPLQQPSPVSTGQIVIKGQFIGAQAADILLIIVHPWGPCANVSWTDPNELRCTAPRGAGEDQIVLVKLRGTHTRSGHLSFKMPQFVESDPTFIIPHASGSNQTAQIRLCSETPFAPHGFNLSSAFTNTNSFVKIGGAICDAFEVLNGTCIHCSVRLADVSVTGESKISLRGSIAALPATFSIRQPPSISAIDTPIVSAAGGKMLSLLGLSLASHEPDSIHVHIGNSKRPVLQVRSDSLLVQVPPQASAGNKTVGILVLFETGHKFVLEKALQFASPEVFGVSAGAEILVASPEANSFINTSKHSTSLSGMSLNDGPLNVSSFQFLLPGNAPVRCSELDGQQVVDEAGRIATCHNFDTSRFPVPPAGQRRLAQIRFETAQGLRVESALGSVQLVGPPVLTSLSATAVQVGQQETLSGTNLGLKQEDIVGLFVGTQRVESFLRSSDRVVQFTVPAPGGGELDLLTNLQISIQLSSGYIAVAEQRVQYIIPPQRPQTPPVLVCPFRSLDGQAHVYVEWKDDNATQLTPVTGWSIQIAQLNNGGNLDTTQAIEQVVTPDTVAAGEFVTNALPPAHCTASCAGGSSNAHANSSNHVKLSSCQSLRLPITTAVSGVLWVAVAAQVRGEQRAGVASAAPVVGPFSKPSGPIFPQCDEGSFLWTIPLRHAAWSEVQCIPCPQGAVCGGLPYEGIRAAAGYYRAPWQKVHLLDDVPQQFLRCASDEICLGDRKQAVVYDPQLFVPERMQQQHFMKRPQIIPSSWTALNNSAAGMFLIAPSGQYVSRSASDSDQCHTSRAGALCSACKPGYSQSSELGSPCIACPSPSTSWLRLSAGLVAVIVVIAGLTASTVRSKGAPSKLYVALMKIAVNHMQQLGIAASFPFKWPQQLQSMFSVFEATSSVGEALIRADCLGADTVSPFRGSQIVILLIPFVLAFVILVVWMILKPPICSGTDRTARDSIVNATAPAASTAGGDTAAQPEAGHIVRDSSPINDNKAVTDSEFGATIANPMRLAKQPATRAPKLAATMLSRRRQQHSEASKKSSGLNAYSHLSRTEGIIVTATVAAFVLHLSLARSALSLMSCRRVAGELFLAGDMRIRCSEASVWMYGIAVPAFLLYGLGIVGVTIAILKFKQDVLDKAHTREVFGFLFAPYRSGRYFWEACIQARKVLLASVAVLIAPVGVGAQAHLALLLLAGCAVAQGHFKPYSSPLANNLEISSLYVTVASLAAGLSLADVDTAVEMQIAASVSVLITNAALMATLGFFILRSLYTTGYVVAVQRAKSIRQMLSSRSLLGSPAAAGKAAAPAASAPQASATSPPPIMSKKRRVRASLLLSGKH